jgi:hypothetical protein
MLKVITKMPLIVTGITSVRVVSGTFSRANSKLVFSTPPPAAPEPRCSLLERHSTFPMVNGPASLDTIPTLISAARDVV